MLMTSPYFEMSSAMQIGKRQRKLPTVRHARISKRSNPCLSKQSVNSNQTHAKHCALDVMPTFNCMTFLSWKGSLHYVAEMGDTIKMQTGHNDARLRVIYGNGTESNLLLRSLQKALWKDETGRRLDQYRHGAAVC
jgi:hypothetical protein